MPKEKKMMITEVQLVNGEIVVRGAAEINGLSFATLFKFPLEEPENAAIKAAAMALDDAIRDRIGQGLEMPSSKLIIPS